MFTWNVHGDVVDYVDFLLSKSRQNARLFLLIQSLDFKNAFYLHEYSTYSTTFPLSVNALSGLQEARSNDDPGHRSLRSFLSFIENPLSLEGRSFERAEGNKSNLRSHLAFFPQAVFNLRSNL